MFFSKGFSPILFIYLLSFNPCGMKGKFAVGVDLGATRVKLGLVKLGPAKGVCIERFSEFDTLAKQGRESVGRRIAFEVRSLVDESGVPPNSIAGVGIGFPADIDLKKTA